MSAKRRRVGALVAGVLALAGVGFVPAAGVTDPGSPVIVSPTLNQVLPAGSTGVWTNFYKKPGGGGTTNYDPTLGGLVPAGLRNR